MLKGKMMTSEPAIKAHKPEFSKIRQALFPIYTEELRKFLPIAFIMLCILFNYTVLRNTKDSLIGTAAGAGIEAIPYLKSIFVMSSAIAFVVLYTKLSNMFSAEKLFYILTSTFLIFFGAFALVIYPNIGSLHPDLDTVHALQNDFPRIRFLFSVWGVWTYSLFYVMSELWGSVMVSLLFWQFANEVVRSDEAKRFYPIFVLIGNIALILSGEAVERLSSIRDSLPADVDAWGVSLNYLMTLIVTMGVLCMITYRWLTKNVLTDPKYYDAAGPKKEKKKKPKMGVIDSFKYVFSNPYIGLIALLVLSYGMSINLIELIWKKQISLQFAGDTNAFNAFMGSFSKWTGIGTIAII
ncbi:MAG: NTP/NDP exchange transporter, partial [Flavobacteriaceae bacterium]|nr:NTP/NDP exchange transporter [Flavobacteriaceae bacterium]